MPQKFCSSWQDHSRRNSATHGKNTCCRNSAAQARSHAAEILRPIARSHATEILQAHNKNTYHRNSATYGKNTQRRNSAAQARTRATEILPPMERSHGTEILQPKIRTHIAEILQAIETTEKNMPHNYYKLDTMKDKLSFFNKPNLMQGNKFYKNLKM